MATSGMNCSFTSRVDFTSTSAWPPRRRSSTSTATKTPSALKLAS
ncbi:hypothetical protein [Anaeromyxobacter diazotrophicus]|nr:hypothetical protein [Anaeromyxobacter diazotrophicus]